MKPYKTPETNQNKEMNYPIEDRQHKLTKILSSAQDEATENIDTYQKERLLELFWSQIGENVILALSIIQSMPSLMPEFSAIIKLYAEESKNPAVKMLAWILIWKHFVQGWTLFDHIYDFNRFHDALNYYLQEKGLIDSEGDFYEGDDFDPLLISFTEEIIYANTNSDETSEVLYRNLIRLHNEVEWAIEFLKPFLDWIIIRSSHEELKSLSGFLLGNIQSNNQEAIPSWNRRYSQLSDENFITRISLLWINYISNNKGLNNHMLERIKTIEIFDAIKKMDWGKDFLVSKIKKSSSFYFYLSSSGPEGLTHIWKDPDCGPILMEHIKNNWIYKWQLKRLLPRAIDSNIFKISDLIRLTLKGEINSSNISPDNLLYQLFHQFVDTWFEDYWEKQDILKAMFLKDPWKKLEILKKLWILVSSTNKKDFGAIHTYLMQERTSYNKGGYLEDTKEVGYTLGGYRSHYLNHMKNDIRHRFSRRGNDCRIDLEVKENVFTGYIIAPEITDIFRENYKKIHRL